jgi:DNA invertase Pin-like site-specific DNA recombinase
MPLCYGYVRWSADSQEEGDSRTRQEGYVAAWLKKNANRVQWDRSLGDDGFFRDEGKSGHLRTSLDGYKLGEFLEHCKSGRVQKGSYLLVENLDRITREHPWEALRLVDSLLRAGVVLVSLSPEKEYRDRLEFTDIMVVAATTERAYQESDKKRERCGKAWQALKANAAGGAVMTSNVPSWCAVVGRKRIGSRYVGGTIKADPAKAATVQRLFELVLTGKGCKALAEQMTAERVPVVGRGKRWTESVVYNILTNPAVHGEYRPHVGRMGNGTKGIPHTRKPTGQVLPNYYPAIIDKTRFQVVADELARRFSFKGRRGKHVNLFAGMLIDARDGGGFSYRHSNTHPPTLIPLGAKSGTGGEWTSFNADVFEDCILSELAELKAAAIFPENDRGGKVSDISARHAAKENELREFQKEIDGDPRLLKRFRETLLRLEEECGELANQLADSQREAASPLAETWGEFRGLAELARNGGDEVRQRCRSALRRTLESITCLFAGTKMTRKAAVRVQFRSGLHRDYLIGYLCRNRHRKNPPPPIICTPPEAWREQEGELDLRNPAVAPIVEKLLDALDVEVIAMPVKSPTESPKRAAKKVAKQVAKKRTRNRTKARELVMAN